MFKLQRQEKMQFAVYVSLISGLISNCVLYILVILALLVVFNLCLLLCHNPKARYYLCYFNYVVYSSFIAVALIPLFPFSRIANRNLSVASLPARFLTKCLGVKWEIRGLQYIEERTASVVVINHQSMFDILGLFVLGSSLRSVVAVARRALLYVWPIGLAIKLSGTTVFIDRDRPDHAMRVLEQAIGRITKHKMKLVVFPEGTRNFKGESLLPFRRGAFRMAIQSQLPIVPVVLSPYYFINSKEKTFDRGTVIVSALPPVSTRGMRIDQLKELTDKMRNMMDAEYQKLKGEVNVK